MDMKKEEIKTGLQIRKAFPYLHNANRLGLNIRYLIHYEESIFGRREIKRIRPVIVDDVNREA